MNKIKEIIENSFEKKDKINIKEKNKDLKNSINKVLKMLDNGEIKVSEKKNGSWKTNEWIKKAILLKFMLSKSKIIHSLETTYYDKIKLKYTDYHDEQFEKEKVRVVPQATVRYGSFINKNSVLMPCYINIGAYIGKNTMIDTWSTIGSCAQIGDNVHISGGVGIGGVLEPIQCNPTIIEKNCFIGARSEIVEGVIIEEGSVISMGVYIGQSTKIYDRETGKISYGIVPKGSVVVSGSLPSNDKKHNLYCAVIVKKVDSKTLNKTKINKILRNC
ncbi:2,3,4,5-tetrahydropyridine-2,6-dicarboxylate N-succinyltransferase [Buchnera aphidicola (Ceratoglyphina bambusae)]|uniref:2,3,4,5-tetrahydropyridine-2,6-dicarboxylate N-succinyltransferase n=1 Tax=Buchnera aphidicola TaxID=9 RepID=UPI0031B878A5